MKWIAETVVIIVSRLINKSRNTSCFYRGLAVAMLVLSMLGQDSSSV